MQGAVEPKPEWDEPVALALLGKTVIILGKTVIIGLTYEEPHERAGQIVQLHGVVSAVSAEAGITVDLLGEHLGETYNLPPDLRPFRPAARGDYRLRSTGEVVSDPDYVTTWVVTRDASK